MVNNFLMGGKLGDFLHSLFAIKNICEYTGVKANIYMYDVGFEFGIKNTHKELEPILLKQNYINSLNILSHYNYNNGLNLYNEKIKDEGYIDLGLYIKSPYLYKACWSDLYSKTFNFPIINEYKWINYDNVNNDLTNKVLIQRKANVMRNPKFPYREVIELYGKENILFISSNKNDYEEFPFKSEIEYYNVNTLDEWFTSINSCQLIIANLSAPAVMAHSMDKLRIIELPEYIIDSYHCIGEEKYSNNINWFINESINNMK